MSYFFFNDTATTEIYTYGHTLSLHDALPISQSAEGELTVGNYGAFGVSGSYNDALGDAAAFSVYAAKRKRDGWMDVRTGNGPRTNDEDHDQNYHTFRRNLPLEPTNTPALLLSRDFTTRTISENSRERKTYDI